MIASMLSKKFPFKKALTQASLAGTFAVTGDVICQVVIEKTPQLDVYRSAKFGMVVACITAPIQYQWFKFLEKHIRSSTKLITGLKRMIFDQTVAAPLLTSVFIFCLQLVNGHSLDYAANMTRSVFLPVMTTNYKIWPAVQFINMSVIPLRYRVAFVQFVAIFWNIFLSAQLAPK